MDFRKGDQVDGSVPGAVNDNGIKFLQSNKSVQCVDFRCMKLISKCDVLSLVCSSITDLHDCTHIYIYRNS